MNPPPGILALPNGQWVLEQDSHLSRWAEQHGSIISDPHVFKFLNDYLTDVEVVWDLGANIGDHARQYIDWGKLVVAIEPNPMAHTCLEHNCPEALCLPYAASDEDGSLNFTILENVGASRVTADGEWSVEAKKLDDLGLPAPGFVKIDVEGYEVFALQGMLETIKKNRPVVFLEMNRAALAPHGHAPQSIEMFFKDLGYREAVLYPAKATWKDDQYDALFLP